VQSATTSRFTREENGLRTKSNKEIGAGQWRDYLDNGDYYDNGDYIDAQPLTKRAPLWRPDKNRLRAKDLTNQARRFRA
jgi:hypothetical protein